VRTELLEFLTRAAERTAGIAAVFSLLSAEYFSGATSSPKDLRSTLVQGETQCLAAILDRAVTRGEIDGSKLAPPVASLLTDLFRHHVIMNFSAPPPALRKAWIDAVFLPLVGTK
jgi:tetracycline repressor-like protein